MTHSTTNVEPAEGLILETVTVFGVDPQPVAVEKSGVECDFSYNMTTKVLQIEALNHNMTNEMTLSIIYS